MYIPLNYEHLNIVESTYIPSMVKGRNNYVFSYWQRALYQRACSTLIIDVPDSWVGSVRDFLYWCLFRFGFVAVFQTDDLGTVFNPGNPYGFNFYYQPTNVLIANPALQSSLDLEIGKDCELIKLCPDYRGIFDIINYYAEKFAILDNAINLSIINNKFSYILAGKTKAVVEALKKMFDKINRGEPAVFLDGKLTNDPANKGDSPFQFIEREKSLKESYLTTDQLADLQTILNNFDAEIGIPSVPYHKKERMVVAEAQSRSVDAVSRSVVWYDTLKNSLKDVNRMFPELNLDVRLRYDIMESEGGELNE